MFFEMELSNLYGSPAQEKEKALLLECFRKNCLGAYRESGILPCEEMAHAVSTASVISSSCIPNGK